MKKKRVLAISGGVDSMVLVHKFARMSDIIAHVDHGMRPESAGDEAFVRRLAYDKGLAYVSTMLALSSRASEETARNERYTWLESVRRRYDAESIVTAHHEDDVIETIIMNITRGTGWRGICSLRSTRRLVRPMLHMSKAEIVAYAIDNKIAWREDGTNDDARYTRNGIRLTAMPRLTAAHRREFKRLYDAQCVLRREVEHELAVTTGTGPDIDRYLLIQIDVQVATELLGHWLGSRLERKRLSSLLLFAKIARPGSKWSLDTNRYVVATKRTLIVQSSRD